MPGEHEIILMLLAAQTEVIEALREAADTLILAHRRIEEGYCRDPEADIALLYPAERPLAPKD